MAFRFALFALLLAALPATAGPVEVPGEGDPTVYVVKVHADWCGSCQALVPILDEVKTAVADQPALFVELDVTDEAKTAQARLLAAALGIEGLLKSNNKTGLVLLINAEDKSLLETLNKTNPPAEMATKIKGHIAMGEKAMKDKAMN